MNPTTIVTEFGGLIRQELDIEALLRTTLEFVLSRCGPTNAAVFLPTTSGDYSLGAYVNYDCPKETVDVLLDHLANTIAPKLADKSNLLHCKDRDALVRSLGQDAGWIGESCVVGFSCRQDGEALAVFLLFRDRLTGYSGQLVEQLRLIGDLFAQQLARVIRIHHRHLPKDKWGAIGDAEDDRDSGPDVGGMAA